MQLILEERGLAIRDLTKDDVKALKRMIDSACLNEKRDFNNLKEQITTFEKSGFV